MNAETLDLESLLEEVAQEAPCGEDLEYDPALTEIVSLLRDEGSHVLVSDADSEVPEINWIDVRDHCLQLFGRTKDMRVVHVLTKALINLHGLRGFRDGLLLLNELLTRYWDDVHPGPDPEDDEDPYIYRINVLEGFGASDTVFKYLASVQVIPEGDFGAVTLGQLADNLMPKPGFDSSESDGADSDSFYQALESDPDAVAGQLQLCEEVTSLAKSVDEIARQHAHPVKACTDIIEVMNAVSTTLRIYGSTGAAPAPAAVEPQAPPRQVSLSGLKIQSRDDVVTVLNAVCQYYEANEPSSPVPVLLRNTQALIGKTFTELLRDMQPEKRTLLDWLDAERSHQSKAEGEEW